MLLSDLCILRRSVIDIIMSFAFLRENYAKVRNEILLLRDYGIDSQIVDWNFGLIFERNV